MVRRQRLKDVADASVQVPARVLFTKIPVLRVISSPFPRYGDVGFWILPVGRCVRRETLRSSPRRGDVPVGPTIGVFLASGAKELIRARKGHPEPRHYTQDRGRTTVHLCPVAAAKTTRSLRRPWRR